VTVPLWIWGDSQLATLAILRAAPLPAGAPVPTFGIRRPAARTFDPALPYVMVANDGETGRTNADQTANVRVTVWAASAEQARLLAAWARAVLLASHGDGTHVRHYSRQTGMLPTTDPDTGNPICSFTVAARLRPIPLSTQE
jgi:hypothetical protein